MPTLDLSHSLSESRRSLPAALDVMTSSTTPSEWVRHWCAETGRRALVHCVPPCSALQAPLALMSQLDQLTGRIVLLDRPGGASEIPEVVLVALGRLPRDHSVLDSAIAAAVELDLPIVLAHSAWTWLDRRSELAHGVVCAGTALLDSAAGYVRAARPRGELVCTLVRVHAEEFLASRGPSELIVVGRPLAFLGSQRGLVTASVVANNTCPALLVPHRHN